MTRAESAFDNEADGPGVTWRSAAGLPIFALILHAVVVWLSRAPGFVMREDDARYLLLARALRAGSYRELWAPDRPLHHMYPPGYPTLLAVWTSLGGERFDWLIVFQLSLSLAILSLTFITIRRTLPKTVVLWTVLVLALNPELVFWAGEVSSELSLTLCVAIALWAHMNLRQGPGRTAVLIAASLAAPFVRAAGIALPVALVFEWLLERRTRPALLASGLFVLVLAPLFWWSLATGGVVGTSYAADAVLKDRAHSSLFLVLVRRVATNLVWYPTQGIPWAFGLPTVRGTLVDNVVDTILVIAALAVGGFCARRRVRFGVIVMLACAGLLLVWPFQLQRFLVPVLPLMIAVFLWGVHRIGQRGGTRWANGALATVAVAMLVVGGQQDADLLRPRFGCDRSRVAPDRACLSPRERGFFDGLRFAADSLPADARLVSANAATVYLNTGRPAVRVLEVLGSDSAQFWTRLRDMHVNYILFMGEPRLAKRVGEACRSLAVTKAISHDAYLFRIPDASSPPDRVGSAASSPESERSACAAVRRARELPAADSP